MDLLVIDGVSQFDKVNIVADNRITIKRSDINYSLPFLTAGSMDITANNMLETALGCGFNGIIPEEFSIEFLEIFLDSLKAQGYTEFWAQVTGYQEHRLKELIRLGVKNIIIVDPVSASHAEFHHVIDSSTALSSDVNWYAGPVQTYGQVRYLEKKVTGVVVQESGLNHAVGFDIVGTVQGIKSLFPNTKVIVNAEIFKAQDAVKALYIGADHVILNEIIAGTSETPSQAMQIDRSDRVYKKFRYGLVAEKGSVVNVFEEIEQVLLNTLFLTNRTILWW